MIFLLTGCSTIYSKHTEKVKKILLQNVESSSKNEIKNGIKDIVVEIPKEKSSIQRDMSFGMSQITSKASQVTTQVLKPDQIQSKKSK